MHCTPLHSSFLQCSPVQWSTVQFSEVQSSSVKYSAVQQSTVQLSAVQWCWVECSVVCWPGWLYGRTDQSWSVISPAANQLQLTLECGLHATALSCTALWRSVALHYTTLHCTVLHCIVLVQRSPSCQLDNCDDAACAVTSGEGRRRLFIGQDLPVFHWIRAASFLWAYHSLQDTRVAYDGCFKPNNVDFPKPVWLPQCC